MTGGPRTFHHDHVSFEGVMFSAFKQRVNAAGPICCPKIEYQLSFLYGFILRFILIHKQESSLVVDLILNDANC